MKSCHGFAVARMVACLVVLLAAGTPAVAQTDSTFTDVVDAARGVQIAIQHFKAAVLDLEDPSLRVITSVTSRLDAKAWEIEVIATHVDTESTDIMAILQFVMRETYLQMLDDLRMYAEKVKSYNQAKKKLRELPNLSMEEITSSVVILGAVLDLPCDFCEDTDTP